MKANNKNPSTRHRRGTPRRGRSTRLIALLTVSSGVAALLAGCASADSGGGQAKQVFTLAIPAGPVSMDVAKETGYGAVVFGLTNDLLERLGPDGQLNPGLATSVGTPNDTTLVYHLRPGVHFTNGDQLTAQDVVWSLKHDYAPSSIWNGTLNTIADVSATGPNDVTVTLSRHDPLARELIAESGTIYDHTQAQAHPQDFGTRNAIPAGTGPYTFVSWTNDGVTLERNNRYWGNQAPFQQLKFVYIAQDNTAQLAMRSGSIQAAFVGQPQAIPQWKSVPNTRLYRLPPSAVTFLSMDVTTAPFNDVHLRKAIAYAVDRPGITQAVFHGEAAVALGVLRLGEEPVVASCGVTSTATAVAVTDDTLFQIGSITKVWTTTVAMRLADEGALGLDAPVAEVLPELRLADPDVARTVTLRHLLTHTSGIDGDIFTDTGRGDDCVERYVDELRHAQQNHPVGATFSYCNSGFVLAGRMIERVTGQTWDEALRGRLIAPLGVAHTVTLPEQALLFRAAVGHVAGAAADPEPAMAWSLPRSIGPAGLVTASAADVLAFADMHLRGGVSADGARLLSAESAAAMAARQVELPDRHTLGDSWGLGWTRFDWNGHRLIGHDGSTIGQSAFLRILPEQGLAVTLLTNSGRAAELFETLVREIFAELAGVAMPPSPKPPAVPPTVDVRPHLGTYERAGERLEVFERDGTPYLRRTLTGPLAEHAPDPVEELELVPVTDTTFVVREPGTDVWSPGTFYALPPGEPYVHHVIRATPRTSVEPWPARS